MAQNNHNHPLQVHALAKSIAITMAVCYAICAGLMYLFPEKTLQMTAQMLHMSSLELVKPYFQVTLINFLSGLVQLFVYTYLFMWLAGALYNRFVCTNHNN